MIFEKLPYDASRPIAIDDKGDKLTTASLQEVTASLESIVGGNKAVVFCLAENSVDFLAGYIAFMRLGIVPVMLDLYKRHRMLDALMECYRPAYIWLPASYAPVTGEGECIFSFLSYRLYAMPGSHVLQNADIAGNLALLLTTSGSTGSPKLVRLSYENVLANAESIAEYLNINAEERPVTSLPMFYSYGLSVVHSHLLRGATLLLTDEPVVQRKFWNFVKEMRATSMAGVPYTYEILKRLRIFDMDLPDLKVFTQAGGKLNAEVVREYIDYAERNGKRFIVMYGQTEATARMSYLPFERAAEKYRSIGHPIPGGRFRLVDEEGRNIEGSGIDGELVYEGPNVSLGYAETPEDLSKGDENNGVLYTGDIARRDDEGFYYITGRKKRFVKIFGNRVNLDAVEQMVKEITLSTACIGVDDKITVFITDADKRQEVADMLRERTGWQHVFDVLVIEEIPKNTSGKIQYTALYDCSKGNDGNG